MHMADALLSPAVGMTMLAVSGTAVLCAAREIKRDFPVRKIPLLGVSGAFIFAAQMVNFAIPGTGSSGHLCGAVLLSVLLGAAPGFIVMAAILLIQALLFADGGVLAWGCNLFNMGFFSCFVAVPLLFRPIAGELDSRRRVIAAALAAALASSLFGAVAVTLETLLSGITALPFAAFAGAMLPLHAAIGVGEGLATAAAVLFLRKNLPEYPCKTAVSRAMHRPVAALALAALLISGGFSLLASAKPDALEWSVRRVAGQELPAAEDAWHHFFSVIAQKCAGFPDYALPGQGPLSTSLAGIIGAFCCALLLWVLISRLCRNRRERS